jgi:pyruvate/2-oxoglutarate dehydrogenase complex dihydrolipoamide dehydrogenase (E3) component
VPDVPGLAESAYHTNETIFALTRRPEHLVVVGAGPIGCEMAQAFARLGSRVTLLDRGDRVLARDEPEASAVVERALARDGVRVLHGATLERVERRGGAPSTASTAHVRTAAGAEALACDALLVAVGRTPNVDGLGLDAAGVRHDARRGVDVDDRLRTSNPRVYAVGDVCSAHKYTHAADFQARLVVQNALFFGPRAGERARHAVGDVHLAGGRARRPHRRRRGGARRRDRRGGRRDARRRPRRRGRRDDGFCRVRLARGTDRILGVTIVGEHAGEIVSEAALAMTARLGLAAIGRTMHPYPTRAEVLRKAADACGGASSRRA